MIDKKNTKDLQEILILIGFCEVISGAEARKIIQDGRLNQWFQDLSLVDKRIVRQYLKTKKEIMDKFYNHEGKVDSKNSDSFTLLEDFWSLDGREN